MHYFLHWHFIINRYVYVAAAQVTPLLWHYAQNWKIFKKCFAQSMKGPIKFKCTQPQSVLKDLLEVTAFMYGVIKWLIFSFLVPVNGQKCKFLLNSTLELVLRSRIFVVLNTWSYFGGEHLNKYTQMFQLKLWEMMTIMFLYLNWRFDNIWATIYWTIEIFLWRLSPFFLVLIFIISKYV